MDLLDQFGILSRESNPLSSNLVDLSRELFDPDVGLGHLMLQLLDRLLDRELVLRDCIHLREQVKDFGLELLLLFVRPLKHRKKLCMN